MKLIIAAFLFAFTIPSIGAKAQQTHFIYIQTNDKQPFYVRLDKNVYSSSVSGYLIISKLLDSTYNFSIGFPKSEWPQQNFSCTINNKDKGFLLKNFGDKGWGLFNLQTLDVTMAQDKTSGENKNIVKEERTDSFSNMLSAVVKDPGIKRIEKKQPEVQVDTIVPVQKSEPVIQKEAATVAVQPVVKAAPPEEISNKIKNSQSTIIKLLEKADNDGVQLVYLDIYAGHKDTIRMFIPVGKSTALAEQKNEPATIIAQEEPPVVKTQPVKALQKEKDKKFIDMDMSASAATADTAPKPAIKNTVVKEDKPAVAASAASCKNIASEEDFLKLRKKMASEEDDDKMVGIASKVFKTKCFSTAQIKNLGTLFLNEKGRYNFFDMAYTYVSDPANYNVLESQLSEPYYVNRFKALINH